MVVNLRRCHRSHIASLLLTGLGEECAAVPCPPEMGKIKKHTSSNSPIKCWLSSDTSPLHPCDWLRLACGWARARGSAGQTRSVFQTGADAAIILPLGVLIQSKCEHVRWAGRVWQMWCLRLLGWMSIMKPRWETVGREVRYDDALTKYTCTVLPAVLGELWITAVSVSVVHLWVGHL